MINVFQTELFSSFTKLFMPAWQAATEGDLLYNLTPHYYANIHLARRPEPSEFL